MLHFLKLKQNFLLDFYVLQKKYRVIILTKNLHFITVDGGNAIPLPPRDRSKSLNVAKPRHQRKHPLIIPGGEQRLLEKVMNVENESAGL